MKKEKPKPILWADLNVLKEAAPPFIIDPYVPREGIVLLWAPTSIGKSPTTWAMASAIGNGTSFFGLPAKAGKVLYIELDTPRPVFAPRVRKLKPAPNVWWLFMKPLGIPTIMKEDLETLVKCNEEIEPDVVFIDTLRKCHDLDDKDSVAPKKVYSFFQMVFPKSALVFVHHTRKAPTNPQFEENGKENFSGSNHWLDDAQVGIRLEQRKSNHANLRLVHTKAQVTEQMRGLDLKLAKDGSHMSCPRAEQLASAYELLSNPDTTDLPKGEIDERVANDHDISTRTARELRKCVERKEFPGSRLWLSPLGRLVEEGKEGDDGEAD